MNTTVAAKNIVIATAAAKIATNSTIANYFKGHYKFGARWAPFSLTKTGKIPLRSSAPKVINNVVVQFNKKPQVVLTRTHGRTTLAERLEMALYAKCITLDLVAKKFAVTQPTVCIYSKKYGHLV